MELSTYALESFRESGEFVYYRGQRHVEPCNILVVAPFSKHPAQSVIKRLEHEYALRPKLDPAWAAVPLALVRENGKTVLVLEDPGGQPLETLLEQPLDLTEFLRLSIGLAKTLGRLHERGIVHRDVNPASIRVNISTGRVWLTNFGIASDPVREPLATEPPESAGVVLAYMAPEQTGRLNRSIDRRSDLYSLGVTLYRMLTGTLPFIASEPIDWIHCHIAKQPATPEKWRKEVPPALSHIVLKLLAKTPEERYQTAVGLEADLKRCFEELASLGNIKAFVLGARDLSDRLVIAEKLYGRDPESKALLEAFERVAASGTSELVLVSGYSGVGKSSVVNELHKAITPSRGLFVSGKFDQYQPDVPYATIAQAFQSLVRQILSKNEAEVAFWRDVICHAVNPYGQLIVNLVPELELVIGEQAPVPDLPAQEADSRFQRVFRAFLTVFTRSNHPLALFVDDLQWLDAATLKLLENLVIGPEIRHLLVIGAYRDNEVGPSHPLTLMLNSIRQSRARVREITLRPLSLDDVSRFVSDTLHHDHALAEPLARLIHEKSGGNPFFAIQFLAAMAEERLIEFDPRKMAWRWDIDRIRTQAITDNVADLLIKKLNRLPGPTKEALKQLACLGNTTITAALMVLRGKSEATLHSDVREAIREGCVVRLDGSYKFVHDRIQEAAYSLIPNGDRAEAHLRIGRLLLEQMSAAEIDDHVFEVVNQLNYGLALIRDRNERQRIAQLNFRAGKKAKASTAYKAARAYLSAGASLLDEGDWEGSYEFAFDLCLLRAECEFLCGRFDEAEVLISSLLKRSVSKLRQAAAYRLRIDLYILKSAYHEAVGSALECLRLFGIDLSMHPTSQQVQSEYEKVWFNLEERSIESLAGQPLMVDPEIQAIMQVLSVLYSPAFFVDTNLFFLSICHIVNLSLKYGVTGASAHGYAYFGFILGPAYKRYVEGYLFGQLGVDLVEKHAFVAYKAKLSMTMAWVAIWTQPITTALEFIRVAFSAAVEIGDLTYACYACDHTITNLLARGDHLDEVWRESERCLDFVRKAGSRDYFDRITTQRQFIQNMRGWTDTFSTFSDLGFDEAAFEAQLPRDQAIACWYWVLKLQARFISGDYELAIAAAQKAKPLLWAATGCIQLPDYHYYHALSIAGLLETSSPNQQIEWRENLRAHSEQLREWAEHCSITFLDKHALVAAEIARIEARELDAMRFYEQAIRYAREGGFVQNEAIANEVAAKFYLGRGFEIIGYAHLRNARACYLRWGALGKVSQLDRLYPGLESGLRGGGSPTEPPFERLDLMTVVKALQAVSREINLGKLIETLMVIAIQHAGAERGLLILPSGNELRIEAEAKTVRETVAVDLRPTHVTSADLPESILRYVIRARKSVILDDVALPNLFSDDEYLRCRNCRSILCVPLLKQRELSGLLYLENNLTSQVFTPERLAVLELLASQAAISLENAQLYADLRRENIDRSKAEQSLRESEERWRRLFENSSAGIALIDSEGRYVTANLALQRMLGYTEAELKGLTVPEITHEEDRSRTEGIIAETIAGERREYRIEQRYQRKNGGIVWADVSTVFVPASKDMPGVFSTVVVDITERKQAEAEARKHREELAHLSRVAMMGEMAGSLAHELNQPLTGIVNYASAGRRFIAKGRGEIPKLDGLFEAVVEDGRRAGEIIRGIRGMVQKGKEMRGPVNINDVIAGVLRLVHSDALEHHCALMTDLDLESSLVEGDKVQLQQVLLNLIVNAFEAMTEIPVTQRRVIIRERQSDGRVIVSVRDFGAGLPMGEPQQIFEQFFSTKRNGMGMGLAIVRSIIVSHDGELGAENAEGGGALVHFSLPIIAKGQGK